MPAAGKTCVICGVDCADKPRVKDAKGHYYCRPCYDAAMARRKMGGHAKKKEREEEPVALAPPADDDVMPDLRASLLDDEDDAGGSPCPQCGSNLPSGAVLCVNCGFDLRAGEAVKTVAVVNADADDSTAPATRWPTVIGIIGIVWGGLNVAYGVISLPILAIAVEWTSLVGSLLMTMLFGWLIYGSLLLLRRENRSAAALRMWSFANFILYALLALLMIVAAAMIELPEELGEMLPDGQMMIVLAAAVAMAVLAPIVLFWPGFLLLWFRRAKIATEVAGWE